MLEIKEIFIEKDKHIFGDTGWYEPFTDDRGKLFRYLQKEYGRCTGNLYKDNVPIYLLNKGMIQYEKGRESKQVGWVFESRQEYTDYEETYIREVWVEFRETN